MFDLVNFWLIRITFVVPKVTKLPDKKTWLSIQENIKSTVIHLQLSREILPEKKDQECQ